MSMRATSAASVKGAELRVGLPSTRPQRSCATGWYGVMTARRRDHGGDRGGAAHHIVLPQNGREALDRRSTPFWNVITPWSGRRSPDQLPAASVSHSLTRTARCRPGHGLRIVGRVDLGEVQAPFTLSILRRAPQRLEILAAREEDHLGPAREPSAEVAADGNPAASRHTAFHPMSMRRDHSRARVPVSHSCGDAPRSRVTFSARTRPEIVPPA